MTLIAKGAHKPAEGAMVPAAQLLSGSNPGDELEWTIYEEGSEIATVSHSGAGSELAPTLD